MVSRTYDLYNVQITSCCRRSDPSPHTLADLKRNCHIRLFREITRFDEVQDYDYIFPTSAAVVECEAKSLHGVMNEQSKQITRLQEQIGKYFILFKFNQCYNHFGQTVLLPRLKQRISRDHPVQNCQYWKNCTQYLGNFDDRNHEQNTLQEQIYVIVHEFGIDKRTWNAIFSLNNRRNDEIHTPISEQDAVWLKTNANKYQQFETQVQNPWRSTFVDAVQKFAEVLSSQYRRNQFAQPHETLLTRYKNPVS